MAQALRKCIGLLILISGMLSEKGRLNINFLQNDYQLKAERFEMVSYNKDYLKDIHLATFKFNRTCTAFNVSATFKFDAGNKVEVIVQAYKFASNEYRLFPLRFQFNFCDALSKNTFGFATLAKCGNFTGCPLVKGKPYHICNFTPDSSRFPPYIPSGKYMVEFQILYLSTEISVARSYGEITRPFVP